MESNDVYDEIAKMRANMESFCEAQKLSAEMLKNQFDYLVEAGFTDSQALEIVKVKGVLP